jgi:hypothetical protein
LSSSDTIVFLHPGYGSSINILLDAKGERRVDETLGLDDILIDGEYFFIVDGDGKLACLPPM